MSPDIDRLCASIKETNKTISKAYFLVLSDEEDRVSKTAKKSLIDRFQNIQLKIEHHLKEKQIRVDSDIKFSKYYEEDESMFAAMLFTLTLDKRKK